MNQGSNRFLKGVMRCIGIHTTMFCRFVFTGNATTYVNASSSDLGF